MDFKRFGNKYVLRIDKGEEIIETLKKFCEENGVKLGSISGIGAVNKATIGLFETATKKYISREYTGDFELASLSGNISTMNGDTYLHIHTCLADQNNTTYGGHLNFAVVSATCEIIIDAVDGEIDRQFSEEIGLNLIKFK